MSLLKSAKRKTMVTEAQKLFLSLGIQQVTIQDLARSLSLGEATLYRYFGKKQNLVVEAAILTWEEILEKMQNLPEKGTGYEDIEGFYHFFLSTFQEHQEFYRFVEEFDQLLVREALEESLLGQYEAVILQVKDRFDRFFARGLEDGSIRPGVDQDIYYYSTSHALMGLCRKLAREESLLKYEGDLGKAAQIECLIAVCLDYIKRERG